MKDGRWNVRYDVRFENVLALLIRQPVEREQVEFAVRNDDQSCLTGFLIDGWFEEYREELLGDRTLWAPGPHGGEIGFDHTFDPLPASWNSHNYSSRAGDSQTIGFRLAHKTYSRSISSGRSES